ncbi:hypothetical protein FRB99_007173, partial [Tulasnella sp. 403]
FYNEGYDDSYAHGRVHGLIEGRALGREKGYEIWEEVGFYRGFALLWRALSDRTAALQQEEKASRIHRHTTQLLDLIAQFPRHNPSHLSNVENPPESLNLTFQAREGSAASSLDLTKIRSKYKVLCAVLGVNPRPIPATSRSNPASTAPPTLLSSNLVENLQEKAAVEIQLSHDNECEDHPSVQARRKKVNAIWEVRRGITEGSGGIGHAANNF